MFGSKVEMRSNGLEMDLKLQGILWPDKVNVVNVHCSHFKRKREKKQR